MCPSVTKDTNLMFSQHLAMFSQLALEKTKQLYCRLHREVYELWAVCFLQGISACLQAKRAVIHGTPQNAANYSSSNLSSTSCCQAEQQMKETSGVTIPLCFESFQHQLGDVYLSSYRTEHTCL